MTIQLNRSELLKSLRGAFGFRGGTGFELSETLMASAQLADLDRAPFHNKLGGVSSAQVAALAANFSYIGLQVPLAGFPAAMRAVVRLLHLFSTGNGVLARVGIVNNTNPVVAALTTVLAANSWDSQIESGTGVVIPPGARLVIGNSVTNVHSNAGSFVTLAPNQIAAAAQPTAILADWVVAPGATLLAQSLGTNQELDAAFYWDEYNLG